MHKTDGVHFHFAIILTTSSPWFAQITWKVIEKARGGTLMNFVNGTIADAASDVDEFYTIGESIISYADD